MSLNRIKVEHILYILILVVAVGFRVINLGDYPLTNQGADWALQALDISRNEQIAITASPLYVFLSGSTFTLVGSSNLAARLWSVIIGSLLIFLPFYLRNTIGRKTALIVAAGLALDPGLTVVSRQINGPIFALVCGLLGLTFIQKKQPVLAGIFTGAALLSGSEVIFGISIMCVVYLAGSLAAKIRKTSGHEKNDIFAPLTMAFDDNWKPFLIAAITMIIVGSTHFFRFPQGLNALLLSIPEYINRWIEPSGVPVLRLVAMLFIYQPVAFIFGSIGIIRGWFFDEKDDKFPIIRIISLLFFVSLGLVLLRPGRQAADLVWVLVPLWVLAGMEINYLFIKVEENKLIVFGYAIVITLLGVMFWSNFASVAQASPGVQLNDMRLVLMVSLVILGMITSVLVAKGWSWNNSYQGMSLGLLIIFGTFTISSLWGAAQLHNGRLPELWNLEQLPGDAVLLVDTLEDLSNWNTGHHESLDVVVAVDDPSMEWALRSFKNVEYVSEAEWVLHGNQQLLKELPSVIITNKDQSVPSLSVVYRGQDFIWRISPAWAGVLPADFLSWLWLRQAPTRYEEVILWARSDLFAGGELTEMGTEDFPTISTNVDGGMTE